MDVKALAARLARELDLSVTDAGTYFVRPDQLGTLVRMAMVLGMEEAMTLIDYESIMPTRKVYQRIKELS